MMKVKIQTSPSGTFPTAFGAALAEMSKTKAETQYPFGSYPFGSLVPLWSRQVRIGLFFSECTAHNFFLQIPLHYGEVLLHSRFH
jgi:hypothetical protein